MGTRTGPACPLTRMPPKQTYICLIALIGVERTFYFSYKRSSDSTALNGMLGIVMTLGIRHSITTRVSANTVLLTNYKTKLQLGPYSFLPWNGICTQYVSVYLLMHAKLYDWACRFVIKRRSQHTYLYLPICMGCRQNTSPVNS